MSTTMSSSGRMSLILPAIHVLITSRLTFLVSTRLSNSGGNLVAFRTLWVAASNGIVAKALPMSVGWGRLWFVARGRSRREERREAHVELLHVSLRTRSPDQSTPSPPATSSRLHYVARPVGEYMTSKVSYPLSFYPLSHQCQNHSQGTRSCKPSPMA